MTSGWSTGPQTRQQLSSRHAQNSTVVLCTCCWAGVCSETQFICSLGVQSSGRVRHRELVAPAAAAALGGAVGGRGPHHPGLVRRAGLPDAPAQKRNPCLTRMNGCLVLLLETGSLCVFGMCQKVLSVCSGGALQDTSAKLNCFDCCCAARQKSNFWLSKTLQDQIRFVCSRCIKS